MRKAIGAAFLLGSMLLGGCTDRPICGDCKTCSVTCECVSTIPNSGLLTDEFSAMRVDPVESPNEASRAPARYSELSVPDPGRFNFELGSSKEKHGQFFNYDGALETGSMTYVRGIWFARNALSDPKSNHVFSPAIIAFFNGRPPVLDHSKPENMFQNGVFTLQNIEYCQFITVRLTWGMRRSLVQSAGPNSMFYKEPQLDIFGTKALATGATGRVRVHFEVATSNPTASGVDIVANRFPSNSTFVDVNPEKTCFEAAKNELVPAVHKNFAIESPWFFNAQQVSHTVSVTVLEEALP